MEKVKEEVKEKIWRRVRMPRENCSFKTESFINSRILKIVKKRGKTKMKAWLKDGIKGLIIAIVLVTLIWVLSFFGNPTAGGLKAFLYSLMDHFIVEPCRLITGWGGEELFGCVVFGPLLWLAVGFLIGALIGSIRIKRGLE